MALLEYNRELGQCVTTYKNLIDTYFLKRNCWDQVKKYSNDYEFLFTALTKYPYVAKVCPPSRSYFKLWEILKTYSILELAMDDQPLITAHVAEGPGGFIECIVDWMMRYYPEKQITVHGMTLMSPEKVVPQWRLSRHKTMGRVRLHTGADNTGDLYNVDNIDHFVESVGEGSCTLVTGDGGFDINGQYNSQEDMMHRLIVAEIYTSLRVCKIGGCVIIKIFDCFMEQTMRILHMFQTCFEDMHLNKPLSSRPANSEKYVVCLRKKTVNTSLMYSMREAVRTGNMAMLGFKPIPHAFLSKMVRYNTDFCFNQMFCICKTISFINILYQKKKKEFLDDILANQYKLCRDWCIQYDIPYKELPL